MIFAINNVRALQIFQILRQGAAILISILLAKSWLSTEAIGIFEMLTFIGTTVSFFWITGLNQGMLPFFPKRTSLEKKQFISNVFVLFCAISGFVVTLLFFFEKTVTQWLVGQDALPYFGWYAVYLLFYMPSFLVDYIYLLKNQPKKIISFGCVVFSLQIFVVVVPIFLGWGLKWSIIGLVGLGVTRFIWLLFVIVHYSSFSWNGSLMLSYGKLSFPLILYALLSGFPTLFDSWVVGWFYDDKATFAIFRYGARELPLAIALANALSTAMIPEVVKKGDAAMRQLKSKVLQLYHILFPISIVLVLTSWWWFPKVFNSDFAESAAVFNVFLLVIISRLVFPQTILIASGKTKIILYISILETILNVVLSIWLVQSYGLVGIAFGTVIAYFFEKIAIAVYLYFRFQISFAQYTPVGWFLGYSFLLVGAYYFS
ncbi:MAG: polysaccharide biosynthesis C-terminal domain-containing protein [Bacteroidota bacterium]